MAFLTQGGSQISSSQIVDEAIVNADINPAAAIALTKLSGLIGNPGTFLSVETSTSTPYSLTTVANQRVIVFAKATVTDYGSAQKLYLKYNGVTKDTTNTGGGGSNSGTPLMYSEVPGAATADITIERQTSGTVGEVGIVVIKLQQSA